MSERQCVICFDDLSPSQVTFLDCSHEFHKHCLNQWLRTTRTCPLCRMPITLERQANWVSLYATAIVVSQEMILERLLFTCAFLQLALGNLKTAESWEPRKIQLVSMIHRFEWSGVRLPCLDVSSRTAAKQELKRWRQQTEAFTQQRLSHSLRMESVKQILLAQFAEFHTFEMPRTITGQPLPVLEPQVPHAVAWTAPYDESREDQVLHQSNSQEEMPQEALCEGFVSDSQQHDAL